MKQQKKRILEYTALFTPDEEVGGFTVEVPALPGCITEGDTLAEAKKNAKEAIQCHLEGLKADGLLASSLVTEGELVSTVSVPAVYA